MIRNLLRFLGWVCLLVLLSVGVLGLVYVLSERTQKIAIEQRVLNVVDTVREDGTTPRKVVDALDRLCHTAGTATAGHCFNMELHRILVRLNFDA